MQKTDFSRNFDRNPKLSYCKSYDSLWAPVSEKFIENERILDTNLQEDLLTLTILRCQATIHSFRNINFYTEIYNSH